MVSSDILSMSAACPLTKKEALLNRLDNAAFMTCRQYERERGMVAITVYWDAQEDFAQSPVFPYGCPCREV